MASNAENKKAEETLNRLRKLPENKVCANCREAGVPALTAVVVPFHIFVCSTCKSAHQSFSHRVKSTQMSLWTLDEVRSLEERNGGGNRAAQDRYLRYVKEGDRPREGDRLERFKDFVQRAYVDKRWAHDDDLSDSQRGSDRAQERNRERARPQQEDDRVDRRGSGGGRRRESSPQSSAKRGEGRACQLAPPLASCGRACARPSVADFNPNAGGASAARAPLDLFDVDAAAPAVVTAPGTCFNAFNLSGPCGVAGSAAPQVPFDLNFQQAPIASAASFDPFASGAAAAAAPVAFQPAAVPAPGATGGAFDPFDPFASAARAAPAVLVAPAALALAPPGIAWSAGPSNNPWPGDAASGSPGMGLPGQAGAGSHQGAAPLNPPWQAQQLAMQPMQQQFSAQQRQQALFPERQVQGCYQQTPLSSNPWGTPPGAQWDDQRAVPAAAQGLGFAGLAGAGGGGFASLSTPRQSIFGAPQPAPASQLTQADAAPAPRLENLQQSLQHLYAAA